MRLTKRETDVVRLVGRGLSNAEIAEVEGISTGMVKEHLRSVFAKNNLHTRVRLAVVFNNTEALALLKEVYAKLSTDQLYIKIGLSDEWMERAECVTNLQGNGD